MPSFSLADVLFIFQTFMDVVGNFTQSLREIFRKFISEII